MVHYGQIRSRKARGKAIHAAARTTKGGKGRIKKRKAYRKHMKK